MTHIDQLEKIQRSFTKHITGMQSLEYSEQLVSLKLYPLQRRRERYCCSPSETYGRKWVTPIFTSSSSVVSFKSKLDCYLKNIIDLPGSPGFSNSLDSGNVSNPVMAWLEIRCSQTTQSNQTKVSTSNLNTYNGYTNSSYSSLMY